MESSEKSKTKENKGGVRQNRSEQNQTKNKKANKKNEEKNGPQKESGKKSARSRVEHVSCEEDEETTGDVGNDSGKTVTSDARESDDNNKFNVCSEQDDTNKSVGVGDREKNEDVSSEQDKETTGDVGNDSGKTVTIDGRESDHDGKVNEHSFNDHINNSAGVCNRDKNQDVSSEEDKETTGDVGHNSRKTVTIDGRESDHDGKVNEIAVTDDINNSVGACNRDKNEDVSFEEDKEKRGDVENDSGKRVTSDGRESDHDGEVNEPSEQDHINSVGVTVGVGYRDNNQDVSSEQDQDTIGDVGNNSGKTVTDDGIESDHDGEVTEHSEQDDTRNSVCFGNRDKNQDVSLEEDKNTSGDVGNDSGKTVTINGRESDHDGKVNEHSVHDDTNNSVGVGNTDKNQEEHGPQKSRVEDVSSEEDKETIGDVGKNEKEEVLHDFDSSDDDNVPLSSDDDNVPLSTFKMLRSESHKNTAFFTDIDGDNARDDAACDGSTFGIEGIIVRLTDNEDNEETSYRMSMEEYRLKYAQDFLKGGVCDEATIIKQTRHEVDSQIYSQSDTTLTSVTGESPNVSSDSEPEMLIHKKRVTKKKKNDSSGRN